MRTLLPVLATLITCTTQGQAILQSAEMLPPGGMMTLRPFTAFSVIDTLIQGAGCTWDFSALTTAPGLSNLNVQIAAPASTPYGASFPTANYAYVESPNTAYRYFNLSATKMERVGSWSGGNLKTYSDPQVEYVYPFQLNASNYDTWDNDASWDGGRYDLRCIGTGTLILPNAEWEDALMVRVLVEETDLYEFTAYFWYSSTTGAVLLQYVVGDGFFIPTQGYYEIASAVGVEERPGMEFINWTNPVRTELALGTRAAQVGDAPWRIMAPTGALVRTGVLRASGELDRWTIDVQDLPAGMYVLCLGEGAAAASLRFIKD